ncbi:Pre-mRNA-splicing factor cwf16 [Colletotrichum viniferum]|nr:Pre-mRNA-splicing factor cwf16 [Colletotrichum viniferum]
MSERKVISKYYPSDFNPRQCQRRAYKASGLKVQTVRMTAPFTMQCTSCGEFIGKGRKFNARKSTPDDKYLGVQKFRFFIRCTMCSAEIAFRTDPQTSDYVCETGAKPITAPWHPGRTANQTVDERLNLLEREEQRLISTSANRTTMEGLEERAFDAQTHMAVADALDEVRSRNARLEWFRRDRVATPRSSVEERSAIEEKQDEEETRRAFATRTKLETETPNIHKQLESSSALTGAPTRLGRRRKLARSLHGLKREAATALRSPLVDYSSDSS